MTREEFVFSVGFQGESAIVDGRAKRDYRRCSTAELAEKGLFRAAFCSALYDGNAEDLKLVLDTYNEKSGTELKNVDDMKRMLGIYTVPDGVKKVSVIN